MDFWVKHTDHAGEEIYIGQDQGSGNHWYLEHLSGTGLRFRRNTTYYTATNGDISDTDWHHIAYVKVNADMAVYLDGRRVISGTFSGFPSVLSAVLDVGGLNGTVLFDGNMDELRIIQDNPFSADPTSSNAITVPSSPHTNLTNTKLLLHFNDMIDDSDSAHIFTYYGNASHTGVCRFTRGGQEFNGSAGYITYPYLAAYNAFAADTGNYTIDFWIKPGTMSNKGIIGFYEDSNNYWYMRFNGGDNDIECFMRDAATTKIDFSTTGQAAIAQKDVWYHVAWIRIGDEHGLYINGIQKKYQQNTGDTLTTATAILNVGQNGAAAYADCTLDSVRIQAGNPLSASPNNTPDDVLTLDRTAPSASGTAIMLPFDIDCRDTSSNDATPTITETGSNPSYPFCTAPCRFGESSMDFERSNSAQITIADSSPDMDSCKSFTDDWTIDFWFRHETALSPHSQYETYFTHWINSNAQIYCYRIEDNNTIQWSCYNSGQQIVVATSSNPFHDCQWHHFAFVKVGSKFAFYLDGDQNGYTLDTAATRRVFRPSSFFRIGGQSTHYFDGHIDEFRIQYSNYFNADPNSNTGVGGAGKGDDTITVPTEAYSLATNVARAFQAIIF
jgi:hypothetical protein